MYASIYVDRCMDGWMDAWMDRLLDRYIDRYRSQRSVNFDSYVRTHFFSSHVFIAYSKFSVLHYHHHVDC